MDNVKGPTPSAGSRALDARASRLRPSTPPKRGPRRCTLDGFRGPPSPSLPPFELSFQQTHPRGVAGATRGRIYNLKGVRSRSRFGMTAIEIPPEVPLAVPVRMTMPLSLLPRRFERMEGGRDRFACSKLSNESCCRKGKAALSGKYANGHS
ncbi:hypothetical protein EVAR_101203_1 [Eumeta japonica]|uniref:Uncharacterized protein n=1 Tax=Eumeta variegata TaxID=151549 RepID=A0A4C2AD32_EUMVA|nr:hypothetical protein EVAR_101203_1 [Eumeta japonica]